MKPSGVMNVRDEIAQLNVQLPREYYPAECALLLAELVRRGVPGVFNGKKMFCYARREGPKVRVFYDEEPLLKSHERW